MKRTRHTPEQVIQKLREADAMLAAGRSVGQVVQALGVSVGAAGDFDGDGQSDFVLRSVRGDPLSGPRSFGAAYVIYGR